jgi:hypothetical protein
MALTAEEAGILLSSGTGTDEARGLGRVDVRHFGPPSLQGEKGKVKGLRIELTNRVGSDSFLAS